MKNIIIALITILLPLKENTVLNNKTVKLETQAREVVNEIEIRNPENITTNSPYIRSTLYKGTLNGNIKISLYVIEQESACGVDVTFFNAMYKYENQNKWILLNVTTNREKIIFLWLKIILQVHYF